MEVPLQYSKLLNTNIYWQGSSARALRNLLFLFVEKKKNGTQKMKTVLLLVVLVGSAFANPINADSEHEVRSESNLHPFVLLFSLAGLFQQFVLNHNKHYAVQEIGDRLDVFRVDIIRSYR
jgi:hypothetical protein